MKTTTEPGAIRTLAKVQGWREGLTTPPGVFSALEVAYDAETAEQMWTQNVPGDLPELTGDPAAPGKYGDLTSVDFTKDVVALWSGGESGSCPAWIESVERSGSGELVIGEGVETGPNGACTADRNVYRTVVVISRASVPEVSALPAATAVTSEGAFSNSVLLLTYSVTSGLTS